MTNEHPLIAALAEIGPTLDTILDATSGYRAKCIQQDFSPTAAESMAMHYHAELVRMVFSGIGKN